MEVLMREPDKLDESLLTGERVSQHVGLGGPDRGITPLPPHAVERAKPRRAERQASAPEAVLVGHGRLLFTSLPLPEIPLQRFGRGLRDRGRELFTRGMAEQSNRLRERLRHEYAKRPSRQRSKKFRMSVEEQSELHRNGCGHEIHEHVIGAIGLHADR